MTLWKSTCMGSKLTFASYWLLDHSYSNQFPCCSAQPTPSSQNNFIQTSHGPAEHQGTNSHGATSPVWKKLSCEAVLTKASEKHKE